MKILITGHSGFIGKNIYKRLYLDDHEIHGFDISNSPNARPKDLNIKGLDWVIHLGAISSTTETDLKKIMDLNLCWSIELLEVCEDNGVNLQFASSASVYGKRSERLGSFKEIDRCSPGNYYASSKYLFEQYIMSRYSKVTVQALRYFNVYGPNEEHKGSQASPYTQFLKQAKETGKIRVFEGSDNCVRDFIHVEKLIDIQLKLLKSEKDGVFNIGSGTTRSFLDVARDVSLLTGAKIEEIPFPESLKNHYQYYTQADMNKTNSIIL